MALSLGLTMLLVKFLEGLVNIKMAVSQSVSQKSSKRESHARLTMKF